MPKTVTQRFVAVVNPAAGGGKCGRLAAAALDRVRQLGIELDVRETSRAGQATALAREAYALLELSGAAEAQALIARGENGTRCVSTGGWTDAQAIQAAVGDGPQ